MDQTDCWEMRDKQQLQDSGGLSEKGYESTVMQHPACTTAAGSFTKALNAMCAFATSPPQVPTLLPVGATQSVMDPSTFPWTVFFS